MTQSNKRIEYIDVAKGFAIICVVIGHVLIFDFYGDYWGRSELNKFIGSFHMPLFAFLSGLVSVTSISRKTIANDIIKRFRNLIVPACIIGIVCTFIINSSILSFLFDRYKVGYWYLFALFQWYIIIYFLCYFKSIISYFLVIIASVILYRHFDVFPAGIREFLCLIPTLKFLPYFVLGNAVKRYCWHSVLFENSKTLSVSFVLLIFSYILFSITDVKDPNVFNSYYVLHSFLFLNYIVSMVIAIVLTIIAISICRIICKNQHSEVKSFLSYLGKNSLYIYIFHYFTIYIIKMPFANEWFAQNSYFMTDFCLCVLPTTLAICVSLGIKNILNRSKIIMSVIFNKR